MVSSPQPCLARADAPAAPPRFDLGIFLMHLNRGRELLETRRLNEAREELEQALHLRPRDEMTLNLLGMIYFKLDMRSEAAAAYRLLLEVHPEADVLHSNLGVLEFKNARYDDARRRLETALLLNPRNARPHLYLGLIERVQGNLDACLEHLTAAGAEDLIARLRTGRNGETSGSLAVPDTEADTGPMKAIVAGEAAVHGALDLGSVVENDAETAPVVREGEEAAFTVRSSAGAMASETLEIAFHREIRVRAGRALYLHGTGSLDAAPPDPAGMIALRGSGRVELTPSADRPGRVLLIELRAGQELHVAPGRLLAHDTGIEAGREPADQELPRQMGRILAGALRLTGEGIAAVSAARSARSIRMSEYDLVLVNARDLACWAGGLRARPASLGRLEKLLLPNDRGASTVTLQGLGEVVVDTPD